MGEIVNLRRERKRKARDGQEKQAAANRAVFGLAKADRALSRQEREEAARRLDGHRLEGSEREGDAS